MLIGVDHARCFGLFLSVSKRETEANGLSSRSIVIIRSYSLWPSSIESQEFPLWLSIKMVSWSIKRVDFRIRLLSRNSRKSICCD